MSNQYSYGGGGGHGAPPPGQQGGYGQPPPHQQHQQYGGGGGYGAPPPGQQGGYGAPPPQQQSGYGQQQSSYGAPPQNYGRPQVYNASTGPPAGADPQLWQWFIAVDRDRSGQINAQELSQALVNGDWTPFDLDTVKMLMSVFDVDRSGQISFNEFAGLWKYIQDWQGVFRHFDQDRSGSIDQGELANALQSFGYRLSPKLLHIVTQKYITSDAAAPGGMPSSGPVRGGAPGITFDRFVRACVVIKTLTESFQRHDTQRSGWVQINYDTFMEMCLSAP
ncbi:related to programmed cell death protein (calcium-binding protein) [Sporisorium reilianum f. sp. reilianum]|uniref:Related to programmed cell death protein (Calcium-binding protein) n=1 Tax=Sporisorium reilianum f. sp. reilianum TaxID=72559 RepID=A0A2N8UNQ3_9BASI|nr:related to programmed cell death protein (calcium-binding protein) [Sporisorium reilianum f. sp. reilianum]